MLVPVLGGFIALVFNGFFAGTDGANRFGPAPTAGANGAPMRPFQDLGNIGLETIVPMTTNPVN